MQHKIQTALGMSNKYYTNTLEIPLHGMGQRLNLPGTNLLFRSVPMTRVIKNYYEGCKIINPDNTIILTKNILGIVDNYGKYPSIIINTS